MKYITTSGVLVLVCSTILFIGCGSDSCCAAEKSKIEFYVPADKKPENTLLEKGINGEKDKKDNPPKLKAVINDGKKYIEINECDSLDFTSDKSIGDIKSYLWSDMDNNVLSSNSSVAFGASCTKGIYEKTLVIADSNDTDLARVCILVDTKKEDIPLIANAGWDRSITTSEDLSLSGRAICRYENLTYKWLKDGKVVSTDENLELSNLDAGEYVYTFKVYDQNEMYAHDSLVVTVD